MGPQVDVLTVALQAVTAVTAQAERLRTAVDGATVVDPREPSVRVVEAKELREFSEEFQALMLADRDARIAIRNAQDALIAGQLGQLLRAQQDMEGALLLLVRLLGPMLAQVAPAFAGVAPMEFAGLRVQRPLRLPQRGESVPESLPRAEG